MTYPFSPTLERTSKGPIPWACSFLNVPGGNRSGRNLIITKSPVLKHLYLRWTGHPDGDNTWIPRDELQKLAPDLLKLYDGATVGSGAAERVCGDERTREGCNHGFQ